MNAYAFNAKDTTKPRINLSVDSRLAVWDGDKIDRAKTQLLQLKTAKAAIEDLMKDIEAGKPCP